jgi:uncharacterized protein YndB with AHSA1/START domain
MTVTHVHKDPETLTLTVTAHFAAPVAALWQVWADPRKLERWWGPPTYPATVVDHDLRAGGRATYYMTGPDGAKYHGWWLFTTVEAPHRLAYTDGFADDSGAPDDSMPTTDAVVTLTPDGDGTTMVIHSTFPNPEAMEKLIAMGMEEGMKQAVGQIDALL